MSFPSPSVASTVHAPEEILAHPRFAAARAAFVDAVLALHEGDLFSSRLLVEAMRQVTFNLIVSLHLRHDVNDRSTWATPHRLKDEIKPFGMASQRRIDALVARLVQLGYVESPLGAGRPGAHSHPTDKMMSLDREWLYYHYMPLHVMFPDPGYAEPMARDPAFQRAQRLVALDFSAKGAEIMANNPAVMRFMGRDSGVLVLIKLIQMSAAGSAKVSPTRISAPGSAYRGPMCGRCWKRPRNTAMSASRAAADAWSSSSLHPASVRPLPRGRHVGARMLYKLARERMAKTERSALSEKLD